MRFIRTNTFKGDYKSLPKTVQKRIEKALILLAQNPHHPSLRINKIKGELIKGYENVFEGRITRNYRFFFLLESNAYILLCCGSHQEYLKK